jgi:ClpP class serine protease
MSWLLHEEVARSMQRAERAGLAPTAEQRSEFATLQAAAGSSPRILSLAGNVAEIRVEGVLTNAPDILAMWFGGGNTTYRDIVSALARAKSDPAVKSAVLYIDSPGGAVHGLFDALAAVESFRAVKPLSVRASNAQSAAYAIAAAAGRIEATNAAANFGCIGVAASYFLDEDVVTLTNTESPSKRPDPTTEEGKAVVVQYLDAVNDLFVDAIARGRGSVSKEEVKTKYGRGATLLADEARRLGMIDSIAKSPWRSTGQQASASSTSADLAGLLAAHAASSAPAGETPGQTAKRLCELLCATTGQTEPAAATPAGDLGDQVFALMEVRLGRTKTAHPRLRT